MILSLGCENTASKVYTPVVGLYSSPSVLITEVQGKHESKPEYNLDERGNYVASAMEEIHHLDSEYPAQVIRGVPNSNDYFEAVYYPNLDCWRSSASDKKVKEKVLDLHYTAKDQETIRSVRFRYFYPFKSFFDIFFSQT